MSMKSLLATRRSKEIFSISLIAISIGVISKRLAAIKLEGVSEGPKNYL